MYFEALFATSIILAIYAKEPCFLFFAAFLAIEKVYVLIAFLIWAVSVYVSVLSTENQHPNIPQEVRQPLKGKTFKDYDYTTDYSDTNIFFFMWAALASALVAPYETLIVDMSDNDLLVGQEINHCQVQTAWNKHIEKTTGYPLYSFWQRKWKHFMFDFLRPMGRELNLCVGAALEALFCWLVYYYSMGDCAVYKDLHCKTWVWTYHLLEEVEHTHLSVPEMRVGLSLPARIITLLAFDFLIVVPIMIPVTIIETARMFPRRVFSIQGFKELIKYLAFALTVIPFAAMGQFCEMIIGLNWKGCELERLHKVWTEQLYNKDCDGLFLMEAPIKNRKKATRRSTGGGASNEKLLIQEALARLDFQS